MAGIIEYYDSGTTSLPVAAQDWSMAAAAIPTGWTYTRSGPAMGRGTDGRWVEFGTGTPPSYYTPAGLTDLGVLIDGACTQYLFKTDATITTGSYQITISTDTTTQTPVGKGGLTMVAAAVTDWHTAWIATDATAAGTPADSSDVTLDVIAKPIGPLGLRNLVAQIQGKDGISHYATFGLSGSGTVVKVDTGATARVIADTDGFYRCQLSKNVATGTAAVQVQFAIYDNTGAGQFAGDGASGFLFAYIGLVSGTRPGAPIVNTSGAVKARTAATLKANDLSWLSTSAYTFGVEAATFEIPPVDAQVFHLAKVAGDGAGLAFQTAKLQARFDIAGARVATLDGPAWSTDTKITAVVSGETNDFRMAVNGSNAASATTGTRPSSFTALTAGYRVDGSGYGAVCVRHIKYWSSNLSSSDAATYSGNLGALPSSGGGSTGGGSTPTLTIQATAAARSGATQVVLSILSTTGAACSVGLRAKPGTAVSGTDYVSTDSQISLTATDTAKAVTIPLLGSGGTADKTFTVELYSPTGAILGSTTSCTVTVAAAGSGLPQPSKKWDFTAHSGETLTLPAGWTLTRSSAAIGRSSTGQYKSFAANVPRPWFNPADATFRGLFLDPGGTNLMHDSTGNIWSANGGDGTTVAATSGTSPFDASVGVTLYAIRENTDNDSHGVQIFGYSAFIDAPAASTDYTVSWLVKPQGRTQILLQFRGTDQVTRNAVFLLTGSGTVSSADAGCVATVAADYGGWYWITISANTGAANGNFYTGLYIEDGAGNAGYQGDVTLGVDLAHVQLQTGLKRTAPIVNLSTGGTVTAQGDNLRPTDLSWIPAGGSGAFGFQGFPVVLPPAGTTTPYALSLEASTSTIVLDWEPKPTWTAKIAGTATGTHQDAATYTALADQRSVVTWSRTAVYAVNGSGTSLGSDTGSYATPDTWTNLRIGAASDGSHGASMVIERLQFWTLLSTANANSFSTNLDATGGTAVSSAIVTIAATASVTEGQSTTVTLTKDGAVAGSVTVTSADGTATSGSDYTAVSQTVSFLSSDTSKTVSVSAASDAIVEGSETFRLTLAAGTGTLIGNAATNVTIADATTTTTPAIFSVPVSAAVNEDAGSVTVRVSNAGGGPATVLAATANGTATAGTHYTAVSSTLSFSATDTFKDVSIPITNNSLASGSVTFSLILSSASGGSIQSGSSTCTITISNVVNSILFDFTQASLPAGVTYARTGADYILQTDATLKRVTANTFSPSYLNAVDVGARIAGARTNRVTAPEAMGGSPWVINADTGTASLTLGATNIADPAVGTTAAAFTSTMSNGEGYLYQVVTGLTSGQNYRWGFWAKVPSGTATLRVALDASDASGNWQSNQAANSYTATTAWQYFETVGTATSTGAFRVTVGGAGTWVSGQALHVWGAFLGLSSEDDFYCAGAVGAESYTLTIPTGTHDLYTEDGAFNITKYAATAVTGNSWTLKKSGSSLYVRRVSVDAPFANVVYDFTQSSLPAGVTYTRSGIDYVRTAAGAVLQSRAANVYAPDHDALGLDLGARIAGARTNLCQAPETIGDSPWILSSCASTSATIADPTTGSGAREFTANSSVNPGALIHEVISGLTGGQSYRWGVWLKVPSGTMAFRIAIDNADSSGNWVNVAAEKSVTLTNFWQYFEVTATVGASGYGWATIGSGNTWTTQAVHAWGGWFTLSSQDDFYGIGAIGSDVFKLPLSTGSHDIYVENIDLSVTEFAAEVVTGNSWTLRPAAGTKWVRRVSVDGPFDASTGGSTGGGGTGGGGSTGGGGGPTSLPSLSGIPTGAPFSDDDVVPTPRATPVDVTSFGAVGNDSTDCTAAFAQAIAAARAQGKDVFVPAGTFRIGLINVTGTMLYGSGDGSMLKTVTAGSRTITLGDNGTLWGLQIVAANVSGATTSANDAAVTIVGTAARVTNCLISGAGNVGILVNGAVNVVVDHNRVQSTAAGGIAFVNGARYWRCHHNLVKGCAADSIAAVHLSSVSASSGRTGQGRIWANEVTANTAGRGIILAGCDTVIVEGNNVHDNDRTNSAGFAGICVASLSSSGAANTWQTANIDIRYNIVNNYGGSESEVLVIRS